MKSKLSILLLASPLLAMAHPGHEHHFVDILLDPLSWPHHGVLWAALLIVVLLALRKGIRKYALKALKAMAPKK